MNMTLLQPRNLAVVAVLALITYMIMQYFTDRKSQE